MMKLKYFLMAALMAAPCVMFTACGDDDKGGKEDADNPNGKQTLMNVDAESLIDPSYTPSETELQKTWVGEYEGWDDVQKKNTKIRRLLTLKPNKTYENVIQGVLVESGKSDYVNFEYEKGTYVYSTRTGNITYTVQSDSILDYGKQKFDFYNGKKYYDHTSGNWSEPAAFSAVKDGQRSWISHDTYLQSLTDKTINIAFVMIQQVEK